MFIDLDKFKLINDTLGHNFGDELLKLVAVELKKLLPGRNFIGRYGGDEFIAILPNCSLQEAEIKAKQVLESFSRPFNIWGHRINITTSIGISSYPLDSVEPDTLIKYSDIAANS